MKKLLILLLAALLVISFTACEEEDETSPSGMVFDYFSDFSGDLYSSEFTENGEKTYVNQMTGENNAISLWSMNSYAKSPYHTATEVTKVKKIDNSNRLLSITKYEDGIETSTEVSYDQSGSWKTQVTSSSTYENGTHTKTIKDSDGDVYRKAVRTYNSDGLYDSYKLYDYDSGTESLSDDYTYTIENKLLKTSTDNIENETVTYSYNGTTLYKVVANDWSIEYTLEAGKVTKREDYSSGSLSQSFEYEYESDKVKTRTHTDLSSGDKRIETYTWSGGVITRIESSKEVVGQQDPVLQYVFEYEYDSEKRITKFTKTPSGSVTDSTYLIEWEYK